jgi:alanyl aminopeptidase
MFFVVRAEETGLQASWKFLQANYDGILAKFPREATGFAPYFAEGFCDGTHRREVAEFFAGRAEKLPGGPRNLAQVLEGIDLCVALREVQEPSVREFLKKY